MNQIDVVVKLIIVGSDLRGTIRRISERSVPSKSEHRESIRKWIARNLNTRNAELRGEVQSRVLIRGDDKEPRPADARCVEPGGREDVRLAENGLIGRILRGAADDISHQRPRENARRDDVVMGLAIAKEGVIMRGDLMINPRVKGVFSQRLYRVIEIVNGGCRTRYVGRRIFLIKRQNVCAS